MADAGYVPRTGKTYKDDGTVVNIANILEQIRDGGGGGGVASAGKTYVGMAGDTKPTISDPIDGVLYVFLEIDTSDAFVWYDGGWEKL